jgi:hypothetical protein
MQDEITAISPVDLETVTGGRQRDPEPPGEVPTYVFNKRLGDWHGSLGSANGEARG